ncbi:hypothetical protein [Metabacillus sp. Hm71]|uniref:hypothetical protein n=1 Tax=Metabacillus sp. Hm71 TaxID=3450743 RepID=UPI003F43924C
MDFVFGFLIGIALFVVIYSAYQVGRLVGNKRVKPVEADSEELRRAKELHQGFLQVMNYDVNKALERKKVNHDG